VHGLVFVQAAVGSVLLEACFLLRVACSSF
jgi:hypothetical protein